MLRIACVLAAHEIGDSLADVVVFPEGVDGREIKKARIDHDRAAIVGAVADNGGCRAVLLHQMRNQVDYMKVGTDGRTRGTGRLPSLPVYEFGDTCIGVLICMDIQNGALFQAVIRKLKESAAAVKLLCIPGDMTRDWFSDDVLPPHYSGVSVALCNNTETHVIRCKSFIADPAGRKVVVQREAEPIHAEVSNSR